MSDNLNFRVVIGSIPHCPEYSSSLFSCQSLHPLCGDAVHVCICPFDSGIHSVSTDCSPASNPDTLQPVPPQSHTELIVDRNAFLLNQQPTYESMSIALQLRGCTIPGHDGNTTLCKQETQCVQKGQRIKITLFMATGFFFLFHRQIDVVSSLLVQ